MKTVEEELALLERKRAADRKAQAKRRAKLKENGLVLKQIWVKESDPNQTDLNSFAKEKEIMAIINGIREKNKGTIILAKQKDLAEAIQQIEEILCLEK